MAHVKAMNGEVEAESVFDAGKIEGAPSLKLRPGKTVRFAYAFESEAGAEWQIEATPGMFDYEEVLYTARG